MAAPGWYRDPGSDRLARWFDGREWTHHTVVMADWRGRGSPPPPEDRTIVQSSGDAYVPPGDGAWAAPAGYEDFGPDQGFDQWDNDEADEYVVAGRGGYHAPTLADRYREGPPWFRFGAPALLLLIVLVAVLAIAGGGDDGGDGVDVDLGTDGEQRSLDEVIDIAYDEGFPDSVNEAKVGSLITLACNEVGDDDGVETVAAQIQRFNFDGDEVSGATDGLRAGAEAFCPTKVAKDRNFFRDVAVAVGSTTTRSSTTTTTSTTLAGTATSTSTTQKSTTSTTKKPVTSTTKKPTPTSTSTTASTTTTTEAPATTTTEETTTTT
jgi:cell division septation protein DedD